MEALYRKVEELINSYPKSRVKALDVGCGNGYNTMKLRGKTEDITGLDVENLVRNEYKNIFCFVLGNGCKMPFKSDTFDLITCWDVIEHIKDDKQFLEEIKRVLKPGGIFFLSTPNRLRLSNRLLCIFKKIKYPYDLGKNAEIGEIIHLREYTFKELSNLVTKVGFRVNKNEGVFIGLVGVGGLYRVPKLLKIYSQHIFLSLSK